MWSRLTGTRTGVTAVLRCHSGAWPHPTLAFSARFNSTGKISDASGHALSADPAGHKAAAKRPEAVSPIIRDIDSLLDASVQSSRSDFARNDFRNSFAMSSPIANPRDVAKSISPVGPPAGRSVDVHFNNINKAIKDVNNLVRSNRLAYFVKVQKRFIRPAKYAKQIKREWWRKKFSSGFKDLMGQVNDARRRGY